MTLLRDPGATYTRRRYPGEVVGSDGRVTRDAPADTSITDATLQPMTEKQTPDGLMRTDRMFRIYTRVELRPVDEDNQLPADEVLADGLTYRVVEVDYWRTLLGGQYRVYLERTTEEA